MAACSASSTVCRRAPQPDGHGSAEEDGGFSVLGVSIGGGVMHNVGQLAVAMFVVQTFSVSYYVPVLLVAGLLTGLVIGIAADAMLRRMTGITLIEKELDDMISYITG